MVSFARPIEDNNSTLPIADSRRTHARMPLPGTAAYLSPHRLLIARVGDLSAGGAFLSTSFPDPIGTRATLALEMAGERVHIDIEVVRVSFFGGKDGRGAGMGVSFIDVPRATRRMLMALSGTADDA